MTSTYTSQHIESTFHISGEGYSTTNPDPFDGAITSVGTRTNAHNINTASLQRVSRVSSSLVSNQSISLCMQQCIPIKHYHFEYSDFQSSFLIICSHINNNFSNRLIDFSNNQIRFNSSSSNFSIKGN